MTNLEQIRAASAFAKASDVAKPNGKIKARDYLSLARSLPAMFQNNGLLATWAFLLSKDEKHHEAILDALLKHLQSHFRHKNLVFTTIEPLTPSQAFTEHWIHPQRKLNGEQLMALTAEAIAFSGWLKRAAEALCDKEGE